MKFLDPKNDVAFKKIFGDENHKNLTISFLNNILNLSGVKAIKSVKFQTTEKMPDRIKGKKIFFDVYCVDNQDNHYIIEIQLLNEYNFVERSEYYLSRALMLQLDKGDDYQDLLPVIFVGIVNYPLFDDADENEVMSHYSMRNDVSGKLLRKSRFALHFIELSKFNKNLEELETLTDKWFYFLKNAKKLESIPDSLKDLKEAFNILDLLKWNDADLEDYSKEQELIDRARRQQAGSHLEGFEEGIEEGIQEGIQRKSQELVIKLINMGMDHNFIAQATDLTIKEIEAIAQQTIKIE